MAQSHEQPNMIRMSQQKEMFTSIYDYDKRNCTDCCCVILFLLFTATLLTVSIVSVNPNHEIKTSLPSDSTGKVCGIDYPKNSFIYFTNPPDVVLLSSTQSSRVCVSKCPSAGDSKLDCVSAGNLGCKFNQISGFTVSYYDSEAVINSNGNFCLPTDPALRRKIDENGNLDSRLVFFNSFDVLVMCLGFAIGLSILFILLVHCFPKAMMWITIVNSLVVLLGLAFVLYFYQNSGPTKIIIAIVLAVLFLIVLVSVILYRKQISISAVFLEEGTKFTAKNYSTLFYIILFLALTLGFFALIIVEYRGLISLGEPTFNKEQLYYKVNEKGIWATYVLLLVHIIWGLFFLKESFNFCLSAHAVLYYLKKGDGGLCSIPNVFSLLFFKHLGSVIAAAFINSFFFIPDIVLDFCRSDTTGEDRSADGCLRFFDLVRTDAMAYVALSGNPYCQSAKYCEYFNHVSMLVNGDQSTLRLYRICAHILISGIVSILGLYIKGQIEPYTIAATIIIGMFVCTYIISYQADPAEALLLMYNIDEEYHRRYPKKLAFNPNDKGEREKYLYWLGNDYYRKNKVTQGFASKLKQLKQEIWKEQNQKNKPVQA